MSCSALPAPGTRPNLPWQRLFFAGVGLLVVILGVRHARKVLDDRSAFRRWQPQIQALDEGIDISARFNYPNPPIMAILLEPLAWLPALPAALTWFSLKVGMAGLSLFWVVRLVEHGQTRLPPWAWMLLVLCSLKPIADDLAHGNVNLFILFLIVAALTARQGRRDVLAGILLSLAIACKVTPALFIPYFAWKRSWRMLAGCVAGLGLFLYPGLVPAARLGPAENQRQVVSWYQGMVRPYLVEGRVTSSHINQSLPGVVARLFTRSPSFTVWIDRVRPQLRHDNLLDLSPRTAKGITIACALGFAALAGWVCRSRQAPPAEIALVLLGMLLFSERTWKHHCVILVIPYAVLIHHLVLSLGFRRAGDYTPCSPKPLFAILLVSLALTTFPGLNTGHERNTVGETPGLAKMAQVYGAYTAAFLVLLAGMVLVLRRGGCPAPSGAYAVGRPSAPDREDSDACDDATAPERLPGRCPAEAGC